MGQLDQLLGYLEREGVSEIILGVGRPIAMRNATGLTNLTARPVSAEQLTSIVRGSPIAPLIPDHDETVPPAEVQIGTRKVRVHVGRRGDEVIVRLTRIDGAASPSPVVTQPMARVAEPPRAPTSPPPPPGDDSIDINVDTQRPQKAAASPPPAKSAPLPVTNAGRGEFQRSTDGQRDGGFQRAAPTAKPAPATASNVTFASKPKPPAPVTDYISLPTSPIPTVEPPAPADGIAFDSFSLDDGIELGAPVVPVAQNDDDFELPQRSTDDFEPDVPSLSPTFELMPEDAPRPERARSGGIVRPPGNLEPDATQPLGRAPTQQAPGAALQAKAMAATAKISAGFEKLVAAARERGASDLHISAARVTSIRSGVDLVPLDPNSKPLSAAEAEALLRPLIDASSLPQFERLGYVDFALEAPGGGRLRANVCRQQAGMKGTFRLAMPAPLPLDQLGLPADLAKVVAHHQGLVVIAGPSGHGKTTTLASLVDLVNSTKPHHILTIEDPIEIVHPRKQAVVSQREVGRHTVSFARGLKASLREDPDVIVIGELRDRESVEIALTAAETGHLVLATMSTPSATKTIDRLVDMFPPEEHSQVRASVAGALRAIVAQRLVPRRGGKGVVPAVELVTGVLPLAVMIREDKMYQLPNLMQRGRAFGMIRFDESLAEHVRAGRIDEETALAFAESKKDLAATLQSKTQMMWKDPSRR